MREVATCSEYKFNNEHATARGKNRKILANGEMYARRKIKSTTPSTSNRFNK